MASTLAPTRTDRTTSSSSPRRPGDVLRPRRSPDGSKLAITYKVGGDFDIILVNADGRGVYANLTSASPDDDHSPTWSPDGTKIAFVRGPVSGGITDGDLYVMSAGGTSQTLLVNGDQLHVVTSASWSPDGSTILYSENDNGNSELYTVPSAGGSPTLLVSHIDRDEIPAWGPPAARIRCRSASAVRAASRAVVHVPRRTPTGQR